MSPYALSIPRGSLGAGANGELVPAQAGNDGERGVSIPDGSGEVPYWHLASEFNRWGQFYQADLEVGVTVALSEDKVRRARRDFQRRGWVEAKPGFRARGRNVATTYQAVKWATAPEEGAGDWWAPMHRYGFETVLEWIRSGRFTHSDVVTYICLAYLQHRTRGKGKPSEFFVTKQTLRDLTALPDALTRVKHLYQGFQFTGGTRLFEYADLYHKLEFASWATFRDPSEDPNNATIAATRGADIR